MATNYSLKPATPAEFPFLDLRHPSPVRFQGRTFPSAENAYQSTRFKDPTMIEKFRYMGASTAAYRGAAYRTTVPDWNNMKRDFLYSVLLAKFSEKNMSELLKSTGDRPIKIVNYRHENDLGTCGCPKCSDKTGNAMGLLLEQIRDGLK